jgi:hypothetical protein
MCMLQALVQFDPKHPLHVLHRHLVVEAKRLYWEWWEIYSEKFRYKFKEKERNR